MTFSVFVLFYSHGRYSQNVLLLGHSFLRRLLKFGKTHVTANAPAVQEVKTAVTIQLKTR